MREELFIKISVIFAFIALALGGIFGITQLLARTPYLLSINSNLYYLILTGHGVLMAIVWTSFFIMGLAVFVINKVLNIKLNNALLNTSLILSLLGTALAAISILSGQANVLYTFYAPLQATPLFYIGLAILLVGTWIFAAVIFLAFIKWKRENKKASIPIPVYGVLATLIVWLEGTPGLFIEVIKDLIPMAILGASVDVLEARTYFWYFGHPLVYFWLIPAVTLWYFALPKILNTELFSENAAKVSFILFIVFSTPVGLHHQLVDPGIAWQYKFLQVVLTYSVFVPSMLTAFNIIATMEKSQRLKGKKGLLSWIKDLPWRNPVFSAMTLAIITFGLGGIGGLINAGFTLNYVVHNTTWVVGHFHATVGTAVTLTFMGATYLLSPMIFNKEIYSSKLAKVQPYLWFIGMMLFSLSYHIAGLLGMPRRTYSIMYYPNIPQEWITFSLIAAVGGITLFLAGSVFVSNAGLTIIKGRPTSLNGEGLAIEMPKNGNVLDKLSIWISIAAVIIIIGYAFPLLQIYSMGLYPVPPVKP